MYIVLLFGVLLGTTENILGSKRNIYDVFVDENGIQCVNDSFKPITKVNSADKRIFHRLKRYRYVSGGFESVFVSSFNGSYVL